MFQPLQHIDLDTALAPGLRIHLEDLDPFQCDLSIASRLPQRTVDLRELSAAYGTHNLEVLDARDHLAARHVQDPLRARPILRMDGQDAPDHIDELLGPHLPRQLRVARRTDRRAQSLQVLVTPEERRQACCELVECAAQAPNVGAEGVALTANHLGRHVEWSADAGEGAQRVRGHGL